MRNIPEMPTDWWPDHILVTGKSGDAELSFVITREALLDGRFKVEFEANVDGLRKALWQATHLTKDAIKATFG